VALGLNGEGSQLFKCDSVGGGLDIGLGVVLR